MVNVSVVRRFPADKCTKPTWLLLLTLEKVLYSFPSTLMITCFVITNSHEFHAEMAKVKIG